MKRIILFSLLAITACKKEEIKPNPLPNEVVKHTFKVTGNYSGQMFLIKNGSQIPDSIYNAPFKEITVYKNDTVIVTDQQTAGDRTIKFYIDNKVVFDTTLTAFFSYKYTVK